MGQRSYKLGEESFLCWRKRWNCLVSVILINIVWLYKFISLIFIWRNGILSLAWRTLVFVIVKPDRFSWHNINFSFRLLDENISWTNDDFSTPIACRLILFRLKCFKLTIIMRVKGSHLIEAFQVFNHWWNNLNVFHFKFIYLNTS